MKFSRIVLGTNNQKKLAELLELLTPFGIELKCLKDFENSIDVEETGTTFIENATLKAVEQAKILNEWVIGEDSGLCVDALDGAPGLYSARFSGTHGDNEANNALLLEKLDGVPRDKRTAHYICTMALSDPDGNIITTAEGKCCGLIREKAAGDGGFGYDPLFEIPEFHKTFGELKPSVKSLLSHRARAMRMFVRNLSMLMGKSN